MFTPDRPEDEKTRLQTLHELQILDTEREEIFDSLAKAAASVCGVPISAVSLIDKDRQWFKAIIGLDGVTQTPRDVAFCARTILNDEIFEVTDTSKDPDYAYNPLVQSDPYIRFYAGARLTLSNGASVGSLCVIDQVPRELTRQQRQVLRHLADAAVMALEGRKALLTQTELQAKEKQAAMVLHHSVDAIVLYDSQGIVLEWNAGAQQMFGFSREEMLGQFMGVMIPDHKVLETKDIKSSIDTDLEGVTFESIRRRKDNSEFEASISITPILDEQGKITSYISTTRDISERQQTRSALVHAHQRISLATESGEIGIWEYDAKTEYMSWDPRMFALHGMKFARDSVVESEWLKSIHPDDRVRMSEATCLALQSSSDFSVEYRVIRKDGSVHHLRSSSRVTRDQLGKPLRMVGVSWDVTALHSLTAELANQNELLRITLQSIGDAVITTDAEGIVTWLNPVAEKMTGWELEGAKGEPLEKIFNVVEEGTRQSLRNSAESCLADGKVVSLQDHAVLISADGTEYGIEDTVAPIRAENGHLKGAVLAFHDVTDRRQLVNEMHYRATHDTLTGLLNREELEHRLERCLDKAKNKQGTHALLYLDLDQFKLINDACGHHGGDEFLQQVAKILRDIIRGRDTLARLGGDEFAIILEHCTQEQAQNVAQKICDSLDRSRFLYEDQRFRIGASVGLVVIDDRWNTTTSIMQAADTSCYAAKEGGRNRVHTWFDTDLAMQARHVEMQWATRLEHALDEGQFILYGQRIFSLNDFSEGVRAEVLIRLPDSRGDLVLPGAFLPAAERFHLCTRIDRWVLRNVVDLLVAETDLSRIENLSINLSGQSIGDFSFLKSTLSLLTKAGADVCQRLCLEITETSAVTNISEASAFIEQVQNLGVQVALDDFGAGASSFGYLKSMPVDQLKIDGQFIQNLISDPLNDVAARCFVDVAEVVGVKTVAEFVDDTEVLHRLRDIHVDYAQGFLLHQPEPLEAVLTESVLTPELLKVS